MDRLFRKHGISPSSLDCLAFIDYRALGTLSFVPAADAQLMETDLQLLALEQESQQVLAGEESAVLMERCSPEDHRRAPDQRRWCNMTNWHSRSAPYPMRPAPPGW